MAADLDQTHSARDRLIAAAKSLFAQKGYEAASTSAISRSALTSESQLVRYFGGKIGLLEAIFQQSWETLHPEIHDKAIGAPSAREALMTVVQTFIRRFANDPDLAIIFLFEGRRIRGADHEIFVSEGFLRFSQLIRTLVQRGKAEGSFRAAVDDGAVSTALIGAVEAMIRERLIASRQGAPLPFDDTELEAVVDAFLRGLAHDS